jgi:hypothetical protein
VSDLARRVRGSYFARIFHAFTEFVARAYCDRARPISVASERDLCRLLWPIKGTFAKVVRHGHYVAFQMAEVAISRHLFADILRVIAALRPPPDRASP